MDSTLNDDLATDLLAGWPGIVDPNLLLKSRAADQINLYKLIKYVQESKLAYKIESYAGHVSEQEDPSKVAASSTPVLHTLVSFLTALTNLNTEGRIFYEKLPSTPPDIKLSYLLLSPTHAFSSIAEAGAGRYPRRRALCRRLMTTRHIFSLTLPRRRLPLSAAGTSYHHPTFACGPLLRLDPPRMPPQAQMYSSSASRKGVTSQ